jgi:hypothetical protein
MSLVARFLDHQRTATRDWVFIAFVAFAVLASSFVGVQRVRYGRTIAAFEACAADADAVCAGKQLEGLRSLDAKHVRTRIAQAQVRALLGEADAAEQALVQAVAPPPPKRSRILPTPRPSATQQVPPRVAVESLDGDADALAKLEPAARGDALLLLGDIAFLRKELPRAQARWTEASAIVDDALVRPRVDRVESALGTGRAKRSADLEQLVDDFEKFFVAVEEGSDAEQFKARDLSTRIAKLPSEAARSKLSLAISAAERCVDIVRTRKRESESTWGAPSWKPTPPTPPTDDELRRMPWLRTQYERQMKTYQAQLERQQNEENERWSRKSARYVELSNQLASMLGQARTLAQEGFALARAPAGAASSP